MSVFDSLSQLRRDYASGSLETEALDKSPIVQFSKWMEDAFNAGFADPNAFSLSTVSSSGKPSSRIVLLKKYDPDGLVFFTNYESRKGLDIAANNNVAMLFFWDNLERQLRIEGKAHKISEKESFDYFKTRDWESKLGAWASKQSQELSSRFKLIRKVAVLAAKYPKEVPLPPFWGGYRVIPESFEFWQGRKSRLHDRFKYVLENGEWKIKRLYP